MLQCAEFNSVDDLSPFRVAWNKLADRSPQPSFLQSFDWLSCVARHYDANRRQRIIMVYGMGEPLGAVALAVRPVVTGLGTVRGLTGMGDGWGPRMAPVGPNAALTWYGICRHLRDTKRDWDIVDLRGVDRDGIDKGRTANGFAMSGWSTLDRPWETVGRTELGNTPWATLQRWEREFAADARAAVDSTFLRHRPEASLNSENGFDRELFLDCLTLLANDSRERDFLLDAATSAASVAAADLAVVLRDDRPVAAAFGVMAHGRTDWVAAGASDDASEMERSMLFGGLTTDGVKRGDRTYTFGPRTTDLAGDWALDWTVTRRITHYAQWGGRAQLLRLRHARQSTPVVPSEPRFAVVG